MPSGLHEREKGFWDERTRRRSEPVRYYDGFINTPDRKLAALHRFALARLGAVSGKKILDCGCGYGALSNYLALQGARVTALDLSEESLMIARQWFRENGVEDRIDVRVGSLERLESEPESFDAVVGSFVLHHVDLPLALPVLRRALKKGGRGVFVENSARNPALMFFRQRILPLLGLRRGSEDEFPLDEKRLTLLRAAFPTLTIYYPEMVFLRLGASYFFKDYGPLRRGLEIADTALARWIPRLARWSYFCVVEFQKSL